MLVKTQGVFACDCGYCLECRSRDVRAARSASGRGRAPTREGIIHALAAGLPAPNNSFDEWSMNRRALWAMRYD